MNEPMKCEKLLKPFNNSGCLFEPKLDGYRCKVVNGDTTLDGEVAVLDAGGVPRLRLVQQRGKSDRAFLVAAMRDFPAIFYPFDILHHKRPLEMLPTIERKHILSEVAPILQRNGIRCYSSGGKDITNRFPELQDPAGYRLLPYVIGEGVPLYDKLCEAGWEGMVAKPLSAPYEYGNRGLWKKIKKPRIEGKFQVCGGCYPGRTVTEKDGSDRSYSARSHQAG